MKILVFTPMKVGSTTLFHQLKHLPGFTGRCFPGVQGTHFPNDFVVKIHCRSIKEFSELHALHFDIIFTVIRKPTDMYVSRYFHGFKKRSVPITQLLEHFLSISWDTRRNANYEPLRDRILEYAAVDILDGKMDRAKGYHIYHGTVAQTGQPVRVCVLRIDRLQLPFMNEIYLELGLPSSPRLRNKNQARSRWYRELYSEFKRALPATTFYEKYKRKDEMIQRLFGESDSPGPAPFGDRPLPLSHSELQPPQHEATCIHTNESRFDDPLRPVKTLSGL